MIGDDLHCEGASFGRVRFDDGGHVAERLRGGEVDNTKFRSVRNLDGTERNAGASAKIGQARFGGEAGIEIDRAGRGRGKSAEYLVSIRRRGEQAVDIGKAAQVGFVAAVGDK